MPRTYGKNGSLQAHGPPVSPSPKHRHARLTFIKVRREIGFHRKRKIVRPCGRWLCDRINPNLCITFKIKAERFCYITDCMAH
jgi:hypothetical protein